MLVRPLSFHIYNISQTIGKMTNHLCVNQAKAVSHIQRLKHNNLCSLQFLILQDNDKSKCRPYYHRRPDLELIPYK